MKTSLPKPVCHGIDSLLAFYQVQKWLLLPLHSIQQGRCTCLDLDCRSPGKHPLSKNGLKDGSTDSKEIELWRKKWPFANFGIATGHASGVVVMDIDHKNDGFKSLAELEAKHQPLPTSMRARTGGQGLHIYFRAPITQMKNRAGILPGIDFRGDGGYVVAPPSLHISGEAYYFMESSHLADLFVWLAEILVKPVASRIVSVDAKIPQGIRNQTLISISGFLLSKRLGLNLIEEVVAKINQGACLPPLQPDELAKIAESTGNFDQPIQWPKPQALPENADQCLPLKPEHLPRTIVPWVVDIVERMQVPLEFVCGPLIVAAGSVIGRKMAIKPLINDPWLVFPNLWGFIVANPGSMKSPALMEAMKPLEQLSRLASKKFEGECEEAQVEYRRLSVEMETLKQSLKIDLSSGFLDGLIKEKAELCKLQEQIEGTKKVKEKRFKTNDPTVEKLAMILKDNPQGVLLMRDELSGWLETLHKTGREGSREFYLEAWSGDSSFSIDRIGRGTMHVDALCLSIFGGIQPAKLSSYIERNSSMQGDDGFLERFQVTFYPETPKNWRLIDREANKEAFKVVMDAFMELDAIDMPSEPSRFLCFNDEAQEVANRWRSSLEQRLRTEQLSPMMKSHLGKYRSLMPSLALIFNMLEAGRNLSSIDLANTRRAIVWCSILESHTARVLRKTAHNPMAPALLLAQKIKKGWLKDRQTIRELRRKVWSGLKDPEQIELALSTLISLDWIRIEA